jgi:hypothetical protein
MRYGPGILVVAGLATLAAGCGGSSKPPSVASLGPTTSATTTTSSGGNQPTAGGKQLGSFVKFAHCMQAHGVQVQVSSNGQGVQIGGGASGPSPQFKAAQTACQKYLPNGGPKQLTPAEEAQNMKTLLAMAKCIRAHGIPNFPDPNSQGVFALTQATGIDPSSSQFQAAMQACRPGKGARIAIAFQAGSGPGGAVKSGSISATRSGP